MTFTIKKIVINEEGKPVPVIQTVILENKFIELMNAYFNDIKPNRVAHSIQNRLNMFESLKKNFK